MTLAAWPSWLLQMCHAHVPSRISKRALLDKMDAVNLLEWYDPTGLLIAYFSVVAKGGHWKTLILDRMCNSRSFQNKCFVTLKKFVLQGLDLSVFLILQRLYATATYSSFVSFCWGTFYITFATQRFLQPVQRCSSYTWMFHVWLT